MGSAAPRLQQPRIGTRILNPGDNGLDQFDAVQSPRHLSASSFEGNALGNENFMDHEGLISPPASGVPAYIDSLGQFMLDAEDDISMYNVTTESGALQRTLSPGAEFLSMDAGVLTQQRQDVNRSNQAHTAFDPVHQGTSDAPILQIDCTTIPESSFLPHSDQAHFSIPETFIDGDNTHTPLDEICNWVAPNTEQDSVGAPTSENYPERVALPSFRILPSLCERQSPVPPELRVNEDTYAALEKDLESRLDSGDLPIRLPSASICQAFLGGYVECFDPHFPIFHWPTLDLISTPSPLILSMCSIGALYRLDRRRARMFYDIASRSISPVCIRIPKINTVSLAHFR